MVMSTKNAKPRGAARQLPGTLPAWLSGVESADPRSAAARLGVRLGDTLSQDPSAYISRQWQPFGE